MFFFVFEMEQSNKRQKYRDYIERVIAEAIEKEARERELSEKTIAAFRTFSKETSLQVDLIANILAYLSPPEMKNLVGELHEPYRVWLESKNIWLKVAHSIFGYDQTQRYLEIPRSEGRAVDYFWLICCVWRASRMFFLEDESVLYNIIHKEAEIDDLIQSEENGLNWVRNHSSWNIIREPVFEYIPSNLEILIRLDYNLKEGHFICTLSFNFRELAMTKLLEVFEGSERETERKDGWLKVKINSARELVAALYIFMSTDGIEMIALKQKKKIATLKEELFF